MTLPTTTGHHTSKRTRSSATRIAIALLICCVILIPTGLNASASEGNVVTNATQTSVTDAKQASTITPPQQF